MALGGSERSSSAELTDDDGTLAGRRGSLNIDDEGTPTQRTVLIEDGILQGYMQDGLNAQLMGCGSDRQRPSRVLCPPASATHDQYHDAGGRQERRGNSPNRLKRLRR